MVKRTKTAVAVGTLALALAGTGAGVAAAQTTTPAAPPTSTTTAPHPAPHPAPHAGKHHGKHHGQMRAVEHGELTVHTKAGDKVIDVQRGVVTAVNASSVTVKSTDGFSATYTVDTATKVHKDKKAAATSNITVNDRVRLQAVKTATAVTAQRIGDRGPGK